VASVGIVEDLSEVTEAVAGPLEATEAAVVDR
jgi:hypothetical protein